MTIKIIKTNDIKIAVVSSDTPIIYDGQSTLDFVVNIAHEYDCCGITMNKVAVTEDFFKLSTGVAGEIAQKLVNYSFRLAIIGDFSSYTSKPLHDFIYESNNGRHLYFAVDENEAVRRLSES